MAARFTALQPPRVSTAVRSFSLQPATGISSAPAGVWTETVLYSFTGNNGDGCEPDAAPAIGPNGVLYGAAVAGGANSYGAIFELAPPASPDGNWTENVLYSFTGEADGAYPSGHLIVGGDGALYTTTMGGATSGSGTVFQLKPPAAPGQSWVGSVIYTFPYGYTPAGAAPVSLTLGDNGVLYGTTELGGSAETSSGTLFELSPPSAPGGSWTETVLHSFRGYADGSTPYYPALGPAGTIYGTTFGTTAIGPYEGPFGLGTVFQLTPPAQPGGT